MASLVLLSGNRPGLRLPILLDRIVLGRHQSCDIVLDESMYKKNPGQAPIISRKQAIVTLKGEQWTIEDGDGQGHKSRNGTFVNDRKLAFPGRHRLRDRDTIRICNITLQFHEDTENPFAVEASLDHLSSAHSLHAQPAERLRILLEISNSLRDTLDEGELLKRIVDRLFQLFGQVERAFVIMREADTGPLVVRTFQSRDGGKSEQSFSSSIIRRCLEKKEAILGNDLPHQFPDVESVDLHTVRYLICAPLLSAENQAIGVIQVDTRSTSRPFTEDDLPLLHGVANQASIALSNARFHREAMAYQRRERDLELAQQIQRALLPRALPEVPGYEFFDCYQSAQQIGGDYYDFIPLSGNRLAILLGDVSGKGVPAALLMAKFSVEARVALESAAELTEAVTRLNSLMVRLAVADQFVTLVALVLDPGMHTATVVNAGHPSPILRRREAGVLEEVAPPECAGPPIGIVGDYTYSGIAFQFLPGDTLVFFSDGVSEAMDPDDRLFGMIGIQSVLSQGRLPPRETGDALVQAIQRHAAGCPQNDDITLVCLGRALETDAASA